jgi:enterochelin esterase-like enzyme
MGLTSTSFLTATAAVAGVGLLCVVLLWPLAAGRKIRHVVGRFLMIAVSELLVIGAFLVYINGYFGFYSSWAELFGSGKTHIVGIARVRAPDAALLTITNEEVGPLVPGARFKAPRGPAMAAGSGGSGLYAGVGGRADELAQTGELLQVSVNGERTGIAVTGAYVYLPPQYFQPAYAHAKFPAILALSGYPGSSWSIIRRLKLPSTEALMVSKGKIRPSVLVMMNSSVAMPRDFECTNVPAGPQVETFFAEDVPLAIERAFRVQSGPDGWAALGYSTGGFCAVKIAMMYPHQFSLAVSLAGYYQALQDHTTGNLYGSSKGYREENSPDWRLRDLPAPPISVLVASSVEGENTYRGTLHFVSLVKPPMRVYTLYLPQGGHNFRTWGRELPQSLEWLDQRMTPALPPATPTGQSSSSAGG